MTNHTHKTGLCLCGKVQIRLSGDPETKVLCHCRSCQKASGVVFQPNAFYSLEVSCAKRSFSCSFLTKSYPTVQNVEFKDPEGVIQAYQHTSCDSGGVLKRCFCNHCGSHIRTYNSTNQAVSSLVVIPLGIIDGELTDLAPTNEFYVKRRPAWQTGLKGTKEHQVMEQSCLCGHNHVGLVVRRQCPGCLWACQSQYIKSLLLQLPSMVADCVFASI